MAPAGYPFEWSRTNPRMREPSARYQTGIPQVSPRQRHEGLERQTKPPNRGLFQFRSVVHGSGREELIEGENTIEIRNVTRRDERGERRFGGSGFRLRLIAFSPGQCSTPLGRRVAKLLAEDV